MIEVGITPLKAWPILHCQRRVAGIRPPLLPGDPAGPGAKWRTQTIKGFEANWGRALHFASQMGWQDIATNPEAFATPERLRVYLEHLGAHNKPATVLHRIIGLERALAVLAPKFNRKLLRLLIANLEDDYEPASKRERLQESAALVELGFRIMRLAFELPGLKRKRRATMFRDGLEIALLASRPVRLKNFSEMRVGPNGHLIPSGNSWSMHWQAHEVKNHKPIDVDFPEELVPAMREYLDVHRKTICGDHYLGDALWVSYWWRPHNEITIRHQMKKWTQDAFGLPITPQLFRDCAATSLAVYAPEEVQIAHLILGNSYAVMQKHYNLARVVDAGGHYHGALDQLRVSLASA
jgi:integrase/recombinase XerD